MGARPAFTLGIEEEFQIVDPETRELKSHIQELFAQGTTRLKEQIKREMHEPVVEVGTKICADVHEARREVARLRCELISLAAENGLKVAAAGTHPFSNWSNVSIVDNPRYAQLVEELQMVARANLIFGLHVHVGVEDDDARIAIMNAARYFLPHIFALSVNSPFWTGYTTGWKSYRAKVFERFPRTGIPEVFESWHDFEDHLRTLVQTGCIDDGKKIWWDVRPHPYFPTLEYRICDIPMRVDETVCLAALFQAITCKLWKLYDRNQSWRIYRSSLIAENKLRAARFGVNGKLIDFGKKAEVATRTLLGELLEFVDDVLDELGSRAEVGYIHRILEDGPGADRQLRIYEQAHSLPAVVDYIVEETRSGVAV